MSNSEMENNKKIIKKISPFNSDPHNHRGQKAGKKGYASSTSSNKSINGSKKINSLKIKTGGSGGDR